MNKVTSFHCLTKVQINAINEPFYGTLDLGNVIFRGFGLEPGRSHLHHCTTVCYVTL